MNTDNTSKINTEDSSWSFDHLPREIRDWLRSDTVLQIVQELNKTHGLIEENERVIPFAVTWVCIGAIKPEQFIGSLISDFGLPQETAVKIAAVVQKRIFQPIRMGMKNGAGIDVDLITQLPVQAPPRPQQPVQKPQTPPPARPTAQIPRETRNDGAQGNVPPRTVNLKQAPQMPKEPPRPQAQESRADQPFHLTEQPPHQ